MNLVSMFTELLSSVLDQKSNIRDFGRSFRFWQNGRALYGRFYAAQNTR